MSLNVPNYRTLSILLGKDDFWLKQAPEHINYFTPATLRRLVADGGFDDVRVTTGGGLKLENLFGRGTFSDSFPQSHGTNGTNPIGHLTTTTPARTGRVKSFIKSGIVKPVFYHLLKFGMLLSVTARRPG